MAEPVSIFEMRDHLRITADGGSHPDDALIAVYIAAAREHVENRTGYALVQTSRTEYFDGWADELVLAWAPTQSVTTVKYVAQDGVLTTLGADVYRADVASLRARITLADGQIWPVAQVVTNAIEVKHVTGPSVVPPSLKQAVILLAAHWYENRVPVGPGSLGEIPHMVDALIGPNRVITL